MSQHVRSIFLVRHGRTSYNAAHRLQGQVDIPLDEVGRWQVERTGETLRELYVERRPDVTNRIVVASDLCRAAATAHAFADPLDLDVHLDPRVRERSFGDWDGMAVDDLAERYPEDYRSWAEFRGGEMKYGAEGRPSATNTPTCSSSPTAHGSPRPCRRCWASARRSRTSPACCRCATPTGYGCCRWI